MGASADDLEYEAAMEVEEDLALDDRRLSLAFNLPRHLEEIKGTDVETQSWRMRERMKTVRNDLHNFLFNWIKRNNFKRTCQSSSSIYL
jgi:hypothetical protein